MATKLTPRQLQMMAMVRSAKHGVTSAQVGLQLGVLPKSASSQLWVLSKLGLVVSVRARQHSVWCTPARYQELRAAIQPKPRMVKVTSHRPRPVPKGKAAQAPAVPAAERDDPLLFKRPAIVPASTAPRIETRGVPSVFHLGYAA